MDLQRVQDEIQKHYKTFNGPALRKIAADMEQSGTLDSLSDAAVAGLAFGFAQDGQDEKSEALLLSAKGDGTASLAELAFVRAARKERHQDWDGIAAILGHHLDDERATHQGVMRLMTGHALLRLGRGEQFVAAIKPLLEPPGTPYTLEAQFLMLEAQTGQEGDNKEQLIERVSLIDGLLERGFRLGDPAKVVYYAKLMEENRIEPVIAPLISSHATMVRTYIPQDREEIRFLIIAGARYKLPEAVHAAANGFRRQPFDLKDIDARETEELFAGHNLNEAARLVILNNNSKAQIKKDETVWGPLLISSYYCNRWKDVLDLIRDHRRELPNLPFRDHAMMIRAVAEFQLGRYDESLKTIQDSKGSFFREATGEEASALVLSIIGVGRLNDIGGAAAETIRTRINDQKFINAFITSVLNECAIRGWEEGIEEWLLFLQNHVTDDRFTVRLHHFGEFLFEWHYQRATRSAAALLEERNASTRASLLRAMASTLEGFEQEAERHFESALESHGDLNPDDIHFVQARCRRWLGNAEGGLECIEKVLAGEKFQRRHIAYALKAGLLRELDRSDEIQAVTESAAEFARSKSENPEQLQMMAFEVAQTFEGDSPKVALLNAKRYWKSEPDNMEVLRQARKAALAVNATDEEKSEANQIADQWRKKNLSN